jgi:hypothetical protein
MMNMIELQDKLKNFSQDQLVSMMQQPTGEAPQFMVLSEITRRQKMQKEAESQQAPTQSVAQEAVAAAGVPQGGIADMARSLAPQTNVAQNTGVNPAAPPQGMPMPSAPQGPAPMAAAPQGIARMASGGVIKMQAAGRVGFVPFEQLGKLITAAPEDRPKRKLIATVPVGRRGNLVNVYDDYTFVNVDENGNEGWLVTSPTESNAVFDALGIPAEERLVKQYDRGENHIGYTPLEGYVPPEQRTAPAAESAPAGLGAYAAPTMDAPVSDSAPSTPVFDATVDAPIAPQMPVPPKTDSMPQGPRPSGTQVNIAGNIYAVLGDGSVVDQMGRTPPPPVAEQARRQAGTPAAQFTTQQQYQDAQNLANRIGANSGENAVLPSENLLMGGGREGTPFLNQAPAADTAIYAGGYNPRTNVPAAPSGLATLSPETMPTVGVPQEKQAQMQDPTMVNQGASPEWAKTAADFLRNQFAEATDLSSPVSIAGYTAPAPTATTPAALSVLEKSDLAAELTDAMKPKPRPEDLFAPTTDNALNGATTGATTGATGSGSGGMSDYETELMKIMKSREKAAESDKWLALAQVGMGLMQGGSGSFLGDVGAAGMKGLETLRTSRDQADTDKLSLLKAREDARIDRARIAASAAKGTAPDAAALKSVIADLDTAMMPLAAKEASGKLTNDERTQLAQLRDQRNYYSTILGGLAGGSYGAFPASPTPKPPYDATKPPGLIGRGINAVRDAITG